MGIVKTLNGSTPTLGKDCFIAETAVLIGSVDMGDYCSIWYNAVLRGDVNWIRLGNKVNVQDNATIHCTYKKAATEVGNNVSIGHNAIVHGCIIHDKVLVGMGSVIMDKCVIGSGSIIAAGAVLTQGTVVPEGSIFAGVPARKIGEVGPELREGEIQRIAEAYITYSSWYK
jgi:carbonic anhydrase/acetyltransferase-like protein (isoleucine patch superfamily)